MELSVPKPEDLDVHEAPSSPGVTWAGLSRNLQVLSSKFLHLYTWCTLLVSVGGFVFGFDTGSIGPITVMPQFRASFDPISPTVQGLIVSSILITASLSSLAAGVVSDRISRTFTIAIGSGVFAVGSIISCSASSLPHLFVGRAIAGLGEGLFLSTVTVYVCEISPAAIRGKLACTIQLFICIGVAVGFFECYGTVKLTGNIAWRFPFGMQSVVSLLLSLAVPILPHSPRWLTYMGREAEAKETWSRLGFSTTEVEREAATVERVPYRNGATNMSSSSFSSKPWWNEASQLFEKDVRLRTVLGWFLMAMQQACGIDGVLYYAPVLFSQAGLHESTAAFLASAVSGLLLIACTIVTQIFMEHWGRRPTMIYGGSMIAATMLTLGALYASHASDSPAGKWVAIVLVYAFVVAFAMSWGVTSRIYSSEIQPMRTRAAASSVGQCINWVVNWVIAFSTPLFLSRSRSGPYFLWGGCAFFTVIICLAFLPESKGVNLEDLDAIFAVSPWRRILQNIQQTRSVGDDDGGELESV